MALLQNEDFLIWQLRTSYLTNIKDGIGERLINVDNAILNDPNFRAAGWSSNVPETKRTYSPPIPTAIASDYFNAPRSAGLPPPGFNDEEDEGGMVTGRGSADTVGPRPNVRRRKRREQHDEDDSSDLSDDSEDDIESSRRAAQQIKFAKMPLRNRSGSSPIRSSYRDGVEVNIISPSRRSHEGRLRSGSLTGVEAVKQRARRDTTTSSDFSSENEVDQSFFKRRQVNTSRAAKAGELLSQKHEEDERQQQMLNLTGTIHEGSEAEDRSDISSEFGGTADSESLLDDIAAGSLDMPPPLNFGRSDSPSPKKPKTLATSTLQDLGRTRPISTILPVSLLGQALNARKAKPKNPVEPFARLSGKGVPDPLYIRIYAPFSETSTKPIDMPLLKHVQDNESGETPQTSVADAIGLALWRYREADLKPLIDESKLNVNRWTLRMIEDGEVDFDFPALARTRPITDFTSNNNRGLRGRSREKPYDEFALVEANDAQYQENKTLTPKYEQYATPSSDSQEQSEQVSPPSQTSVERPQINSPTTAPRKPPTIPADKSNLPTVHSTPRMGAQKQLKVHFTSLEAVSQVTTMEITTDTYLAEILDSVCKRWNLDKAYHILKIYNTNTIAPVDRTVEALGSRFELDLVRRRFANDGAIGISGSPGSSSPNAPLLTPSSDSPKRGAAKRTPLIHPLAQARTNDLFSPNLTNSSTMTKYRRYTVTRKQPMSFAPSQQRILLMDEDFMHILTPDSAPKGTLFDGATNSKATRQVPFSMIVGCKVSRRHPKSLRVVVAREGGQEQKRYDFEAGNVEEAAEIVEDIRRGMEIYGGKAAG
ncbi:uncharacterized protein KY384_003093 [Bacidia gigantensis]|uniref:uncharacterized protein n=1 Tax=Bacidia gigantensis TaxID=2732470 RepID=UPI001D046896|nr:uncharacterized protein KY384_003093 [Bacidia gigantensis]KAG8531464.1 hypothetical protein KY384_003093 [Bacidia gigantensis]